MCRTSSSTFPQRLNLPSGSMLDLGENSLVYSLLIAGYTKIEFRTKPNEKKFKMLFSPLPESRAMQADLRTWTKCGDFPVAAKGMAGILDSDMDKRYPGMV